jgi:ribonuclease E
MRATTDLRGAIAPATASAAIGSPLPERRQPRKCQKDARMKKEMLINVLQPEECRIAIIEDGVLEELYVERTSHESYTGNIYKGKIVNLEPAIQAAFVDFSVGRNGFLHVSDVEPQYYDRHQPAEDLEAPPREGRRDRDDRRRGRPEEREGGPSQPPRGEDRPRERPDRSERGRRDRSTPRRFGEGLTDDEWSPPPRPAEPTSRTESAREERHEPSRAWPEVPAPTSWAEELPFGRNVEPELPPADAEAPRGRHGRPAESFEPDLPPSRTQRSRPQPPPARPDEFEVGEEGRPRTSARAPEVDRVSDSAVPHEPRRPRGRSRPVPEHALPPAESRLEPDPGVAPEIDSLGIESPLDEAGDERREPQRRRGGGRAAIRSRGGAREIVPERPRESPQERPVSRPHPIDPLADLEGERLRPAEIDRPRERPREPERERERTRKPEADSPRERPSRPHNRAGEPGYVPRRERSSKPNVARGADLAGIGWSDLAAEPLPDVEPDTEGRAEDPTDAGSKLEGPRRRRRRRGRRRDRDRLPNEAGGLHSVEEVDPSEFEDDDDDVPPRFEHETAQRAAAGAVEDEGAPLLDEFDFGDEATELDYDDDMGSEELRDESVTADDEAIDPELEEEIRREIEEIAVLEREMGLRGPVEARPRRGDERAAEPGAVKGGRLPRGRGLLKPPIQEIFRRGDEVLVQVIKESIGTKGPTLSTYISIPGRYLVLMPGLNRVGVSRKNADEGQRRKLREIMNELNPPKGLGFIVRTAGLERTKRELARDLAYLLRLWKVILRRIKKSRAPAAIYQESDMITRTIRDIFTAEIDTIWIDEPAAFERAQEFLRVVMPRYVNRLRLYDEKVPLFHKYGIEDEIAKIQRRHVPLPEGGSIVIDQTEALVAIDVNSGNFRVENDAERTAYEMNLRAAKEIARQLRLRDLGGVIVNDFIDMREERHRRGVEKALRDAIKRDRARTKVLRMSAFGLIEMTRQRIRPSLKRSVYEDCPHCGGAGVVKTVESMSIDVMRLLALAAHREEIRRVNISVSPAVSTHLNNRKRREITRLETEANMTIHLRGEDNVPAEHLQIDCFDSNSSEIRLFPQPAAQRRGHSH